VHDFAGIEGQGHLLGIVKQGFARLLRSVRVELVAGQLAPVELTAQFTRRMIFQGETSA
jgi:hypothetical protein